TNLSSVAVIATCALAWIHDQPNDSIAVEDVIYVAQADQINRVLRGNVKPIGPELSKQEKSGENYEKGQEPNPNANQPANQRQPNPASKTVSGDHDEHGDKEAQDEAEETTTGRRRARRGRRRRGLVSVEEAQDEADETMRELTATADLPKT
ncbi:unnamed protein product, partial [Aphanomyces euteiches]